MPRFIIFLVFFSFFKQNFTQSISLLASPRVPFCQRAVTFCFLMQQRLCLQRDSGSF